MADLPDLVRTETAVIERTNAFRKAEGLEPVARNASLDKAARQFAQYLAKSGRFAHEADGRQPADRVTEAGYQYCSVAENFASNLNSAGYSVERLAVEVVEGWKGSPPHRKNLALPGVTDIGVGIAQAPGGLPKFLTVQLFGRPASLIYEFRIVNRAQEPVTYTLDGKSQTVEPSTSVKHSMCEPSEVVFERSGSWLAGRKIGSRFKTSGGAEFILRPGPDGKVSVELKMQ
jgi:hypothetical protein